ncbi:hypothetical protein Forpe1208_v016145 [Fusarium oxysporum f. sp. rapae]|uniref:Uncharacterized protein n=1 Tax=Fusarium oxysporum f. sp. rapae TaxID=485398 RepID=A0A8J5TMY3_FUSOX|nr:hypothetical protein Forpe1208_v016145 [Fusarium oxysporum f. sp. rapae]
MIASNFVPTAKGKATIVDSRRMALRNNRSKVATEWYKFWWNSQAKVNQDGRPGGVIIILVDHEIVDRDVPVKEACLMQRLMSFDAPLERSKQSRPGARLVDRHPVVSENHTQMYRIGSELAAFVEDTERDRLLEGKEAPAWLDDRSLLTLALL